MAYFMRCPDMPLEPPDDDTPDNRRYWQIKEKITNIDAQIDYLLEVKEGLEYELEDLRWTY